MEIGPAFKDYSEPPEWRAASEKFKGQAKIGPDDSLENYTAGYPFDPASIDCKGDPDAGTKIIWNFHYRWAPPSGTSTKVPAGSRFWLAVDGA